MPVPDLETTLEALAEAIAWPPTPDLRVPVRRGILVQPRWYERRWALAAVAVLAIAGLLLAYTPTRTAIADFLNLHTGITHTTTLPTPSALPSGPIGTRLGLGNATPLADAQAHVAWAVLVPGALGQPDEVYLQTADGPSGGEVSLVYGPRPGIAVVNETGAALLITEARGSVNEEFFGKITADGTTITPVTVSGHQGWWIAGRPHVFFLTDSSGQVRPETLRLATNTLVLDENGTIVRIEGKLSKEQAEQIAASLT